MKTLFWDFDGTLSRPYSMWSGTVLRVLKEAFPDLSVDLDEVRSGLGNPYPWDNLECDWRDCVGEAWWAYYMERVAEFYASYGADPAQAAEMGNRVRRIILSPESYILYPDALSTLQTCKRMGCRNYLLSNNFPELWDVAQKLGLAQYMDGCTVSGLEGYDKPRRELFEAALKRAGYPNDCVMIGDNPTADVWGARQVGMTTILVHKSADDCMEDTLPDFVCDTLAEILNIL